MTSSLAVADDGTRVDGELGIEERAGFFGGDHTRMFGCIYSPLKPPVASVVLCPSLHADFTLKYRREVVAARCLASQGVLVLRFHYRGTGNSHGDPAAVTYDSLVEDALEATEMLGAQAGSCGDSLLLGAGWGAMIAASVVSRLPNASLALWEPLVDPSTYYREAVRARMIRHLLVPAGRPAAANDLLDELTAAGSLDIVGYMLHRRVYETSKHRTLTSELGRSPRRVLLIRPDGGDSLRTDYDGLATALKKDGFTVDVEIAGKPTPIWFHGPHVRFGADTGREVAAYIEPWLTSEVSA